MAFKTICVMILLFPITVLSRGLPNEDIWEIQRRKEVLSEHMNDLCELAYLNNRAIGLISLNTEEIYEFYVEPVTFGSRKGACNYVLLESILFPMLTSDYSRDRFREKFADSFKVSETLDFDSRDLEIELDAYDYFTVTDNGATFDEQLGSKLLIGKGDEDEHDLFYSSSYDRAEKVELAELSVQTTELTLPIVSLEPEQLCDSQQDDARSSRSSLGLIDYSFFLGSEKSEIGGFSPLIGVCGVSVEKKVEPSSFWKIPRVRNNFREYVRKRIEHHEELQIVSSLIVGSIFPFSFPTFKGMRIFVICFHGVFGALRWLKEEVSHLSGDHITPVLIVLCLVSFIIARVVKVDSLSDYVVKTSTTVLCLMASIHNCVAAFSSSSLSKGFVEVLVSFSFFLGAIEHCNRFGFEIIISSRKSLSFTIALLILALSIRNFTPVEDQVFGLKDEPIRVSFCSMEDVREWWYSNEREHGHLLMHVLLPFLSRKIFLIIQEYYNGRELTILQTETMIDVLTARYMWYANTITFFMLTSLLVLLAWSLGFVERWGCLRNMPLWKNDRDKREFWIYDVSRGMQLLFSPLCYHVFPNDVPSFICFMSTVIKACLYAYFDLDVVLLFLVISLVFIMLQRNSRFKELNYFLTALRQVSWMEIESDLFMFIREEDGDGEFNLCDEYRETYSCMARFLPFLEDNKSRILFQCGATEQYCEDFILDFYCDFHPNTGLHLKEKEIVISDDEVLSEENDPFVTSIDSEEIREIILESNRVEGLIARGWNPEEIKRLGAANVAETEERERIFRSDDEAHKRKWREIRLNEERSIQEARSNSQRQKEEYGSYRYKDPDGGPSGTVYPSDIGLYSYDDTGRSEEPSLYTNAPPPSYVDVSNAGGFGILKSQQISSVEEENNHKPHELDTIANDAAISEKKRLKAALWGAAIV